MTNTIRGWGAVMTEDGPVCDVRDFPRGMTIGAMQATDPEWRSWAWTALAYGKPREGHSRGPECRPGHPCKKCQATAQTWWWEHGKRTKERMYLAACDVAKNRTDGHDTREWGKARDTIEAAMDDARAQGWPWVCVMNRHGERLEWVGVTP